MSEMTRKSEAPDRRAAVTKSSSRRARNLPRTTRPSSVQATNDRMTVMAKYSLRMLQSLGTEAASAIHSGIVGMDRVISMILWITVSAKPP